MSHSNPDMEQEARIREKLTNVVKAEAVSEFILEHRDGLFDETTADAWIEKRKQDRPHRFIGDAAIPLEVIAAARAGNITARGKCFVALGRDQAALDALLAKTDDNPANKVGHDNPWGPTWCGPDGRYTAKAISEQGRLARTLGVAACQRMAEKCGAWLGATKPRKVA